jgi:hypothetical protein
MACPRTLYVAASAVAGFGSAVWVSAIGSLVVHVVLVPATAVVAILIAAAGALLVADWRADLESRQAWAELAPRVAEWNEAMGCEAVDRLDPAYLPALDSDAVRRVLRSHRSVVAVAPVQAIAETCSRRPAAGDVSDAAPTATCSSESSTAEVARGGRIRRARAHTAATLVASDRRVAFARCAEHGVPPALSSMVPGGRPPSWARRPGQRHGSRPASSSLAPGRAIKGRLPRLQPVATLAAAPNRPVAVGRLCAAGRHTPRRLRPRSRRSTLRVRPPCRPVVPLCATTLASRSP